MIRRDAGLLEASMPLKGTNHEDTKALDFVSGYLPLAPP